jgi:hypothetical protein
MKLEKFQSVPAYVEAAKSFFHSEPGRAFLAMMQEEHPARLDNHNWTLEQRGLWDSRRAGFEKTLNLIEGSQTHFKETAVGRARPQPRTRYGALNQTQEEEK